MQKDCRQALEVAKRCGAKWATVVPGNYERSLSHDVQTANVIQALRLASDILEPGKLTMVLEPLSDNPDLFLRHSQQTYMICKAVNSPSCKILYAFTNASSPSFPGPAMPCSIPITPV